MYYILRIERNSIDLVYIGKSGTITQKGNLSKQTLRKRINNFLGKSRNYFNEKVEEKNTDALDFYWFVTIDEKNKDLPGYEEGLLFQKYYEVNGELPVWNNKY